MHPALLRDAAGLGLPTLALPARAVRPAIREAAAYPSRGRQGVVLLVSTFGALTGFYFTVTTLTTTGYGDVVLCETGRLVAVVIMLGGFGLFLRLVQSIFRPNKVYFRCPDCGLLRHYYDAVHCKHCGRVLNIESDDE